MKSGYLLKRTVYVDASGNHIYDLSHAKLFKTAQEAREVAKRHGDEVKRVLVANQSNQKWMKGR